MPRRIALVAVICAVLVAAWPLYSMWHKYEQAREFANLTPRQHYGLAMSLWSQQTPSRSDLREAIRHLEAIHEDSSDSYVGKRLALIRLQLDRPAEYQAMMQAAQARYERCAAQVQAEALAESAKRRRPCPFKNPRDGKCIALTCGNYIVERCWDFPPP